MVTQCFPSPAVMQVLVDIQAELKTLEKRLELVEQRRMAEKNYLGAESYLVEEKNEPPEPQEKLPWTPTPPLAIDKEKPVKIVAPLSQTVMCIKQASMTTTQVLENHKLKRSFGTKEEQIVTKLMEVGDSKNKFSVCDQKNKNGIIYSLLIKEANSVSNNSYNWNEQVLRTKLCQEGENDEDSISELKLMEPEKIFNAAKLDKMFSGNGIFVFGVTFHKRYVYLWSQFIQMLELLMWNDIHDLESLPRNKRLSKHGYIKKISRYKYIY